MSLLRSTRIDNKIFDRRSAFFDTPTQGRANARNAICWSEMAADRPGQGQTCKLITRGSFQRLHDAEEHTRDMASSTAAIIRLKRKRNEDPLQTLCMPLVMFVRAHFRSGYRISNRSDITAGFGKKG